MSRLWQFSAILAVLVVLGASGTLLAQSAVTFTFGPGRDAVQTGTFTLTPRGSQTEVTLQMQSGGAGIQQPAHVHEGGCPGVGPVKYPLTNVVDGRSTTTVNATVAELLSGAYSINVHRSTAEAQVYTACTNLRAAAPAGGATGTPRVGTGSALASSGLPVWMLAIGAGVVLLGSVGMTFRRNR